MKNICFSILVLSSILSSCGIKEISKKETNSSFNYSAKFVKPNLSEFVEKK